MNADNQEKRIAVDEENPTAPAEIAPHDYNRVNPATREEQQVDGNE